MATAMPTTTKNAANNSTLVALTTTPVLTLDLSNTGVATRFTVKLKDFNVFSTNAAWGGIKSKHAWYYADGVSVRGCQYGFNIEESYRSSITNCALTLNTYGLFYQGFNSVAYIAGNQLRANTTVLAFDAAYTPGADTSANVFTQSNIVGNNCESSTTVFDFSDATATGVNLTGNYAESGTTLLDLTGTETHKNIKYEGVAVGYTLAMDSVISVYIRIEQGLVTTTGNSQNVFVEQSDTFSNLFVKSNLTLPRNALTVDSFFEAAAIVSSYIFLPREYTTSTISQTHMAWEAADTWRNNPVLKCSGFSGIENLIVKLPLKDLTSNPHEAYSYRLRCAIIYKALAGDFDVSREFSSGGGYVAVSTQSAAAWTEYQFTLDAPYTADNINLKLEFNTGDDVLIGGIIVSYVESPVYQASRDLYAAMNVADAAGTTLTCTEACYVSITPPDGTDNYFVSNNGTTAPVLQHSGTGNKTPLVHVVPTGIRRI